jgi:NADH-quinone oxidoreductase subunit E
MTDPAPRHGSQPAEFALSPDGQARLERVLARYPTRESALMPALWLVQNEQGWIPPEAADWLAATLGVPPARVWELITFYTMFRDRPPARHVLQVCRNISCHIMGAPDILAHLESRLGVRPGGQTADGLFELETVECLGSCGSGPCLQLGKHLYEELTPAKVDALLDGLRRDAPPRPDTDRELEG